VAAPTSGRYTLGPVGDNGVVGQAEERRSSERSRTWYHTIDLPDGTHTPGWFDTRAVPAGLTWPSGLRSGRCLDVGTFDGFWAFEMERRGAGEVIALDIDDPAALDWSYDEQERGPEQILKWKSERGPGFAEAASLLNSKVQRVNKSVYDLDPEVDGMFDVVLCGALLLHLRDPVRALEHMRSVCKGELLLIESLDPLLDLVARRTPAARFVRDWDQWWLVNGTGLARMVEVSGFEVVWTGRRVLVPFGDGAPKGWQFGRMHSFAARKTRERGQLHLPLRARPRPRSPREV
jgi:SAM-dependent methyltransferase